MYVYIDTYRIDRYNVHGDIDYDMIYYTNRLGLGLIHFTIEQERRICLFLS